MRMMNMIIQANNPNMAKEEIRGVKIVKNTHSIDLIKNLKMKEIIIIKMRVLKKTTKMIILQMIINKELIIIINHTKTLIKNYTQ